MRFHKLRPDVAYRGSMLWLPKTLVPMPTIEAALTYWFAEPDKDGKLVARSVPAWSEEKHHVLVPREFPREHIPCEVVEIALPTERVVFRPDIAPRDDIQVAAIAAMRSNRAGILNLGCGRGKTVIGLDRIAYGGGPGLVIVNDKGIRDQWKREAKKRLGLTADQIGIIGGDRKGSEGSQWSMPLVIATVQTLWRRIKELLIPEEVRRRFKTVVLDESHHFSARQFNRVAGFFTGDRFGLTATVERTDGTECFYLYHLGPVLYSNLEVDVPPVCYFGHTGITPTRKERDSFFVRGNVHISKIRTWQAGSKVRNRMIAKLARTAAANGSKVLVLTHLRDGHIPLLQAELPDCGIVHGKIRGEERLAQLAGNDIVIGTIGAAAEGLDRADLNVGIFATTFPNENEFQQATGRLARQCLGKETAEAIFLVDDVPKCKEHARALERHAKKRGYKVEHFKLED